MAITRKALLISCPGQAGREDYLKGVSVDVREYKNLLLSPEGGSWKEDEIVHLNNPKSSDLRWWIDALARYDYTFVVFTGHGWYSSTDKDRILELGNGEQIASTELLRGAKKRTLVLDSCQKVYTQSLTEKTAHVLNASRAAEVRTPDRAACRAAFDEAILTAAPGYLKLMSCKIDEYSYVDNEEGSRYSVSLVDAVKAWAHAEARSYKSEKATLSAVGAHNQAASETAKLTANKQNPTIEKPGTMPYFPMGVFA